MNKLGINLWNWVQGLGPDCLGLPRKAAGLGFTAVELPMTTALVDPKLAAEVRESGLEVSLCASLGAGRDLSSFDEGPRAAALDYLTACLESGRVLGASVLCGPLYTGGGKRHWLSESDRRREWDLAAAGLRELARRAEECGMRLALEPLNRYRTSIANTSAQILRMVEDVGHKSVGLHFDTYHACLEEKDLLSVLESALQSGRVYHFHACANNRGAPGQGVLPWVQILDLLVRYRYPYHITMETFALGGLDSSWVQVHEEPDQLAANGLRYLKDYFTARGLC